MPGPLEVDGSARYLSETVTNLVTFPLKISERRLHRRVAGVDLS
jgi:hypothetical protein